MDKSKNKYFFYDYKFYNKSYLIIKAIIIIKFENF
jgi:hypothetical protein